MIDEEKIKTDGFCGDVSYHRTSDIRNTPTVIEAEDE